MVICAKKPPSTVVSVSNVHAGMAAGLAPLFCRPIVCSKWVPLLIPLVDGHVPGAVGLPAGCWVGSKSDTEILNRHKLFNLLFPLLKSAPPYQKIRPN